LTLREQIANQNILVIGDFILDEFICGTITREINNKHDILGVPIKNKIHILFHQLYGQSNTTEQDFNDFIIRWQNQEFI
jgi:hypothetical protein